MTLFLEIIDGPNKGKKFQLKRSSTLGRLGTDVEIDDTKLSKIHAFIEFDQGKRWHLQDNGSRNGIWVNSIREHRVRISDGLEFMIGQSVIRCRLVKTSSKKVGELFLDWLQGVSQKLVNSPMTIEEVKPEVRLKVIEGQQMGETWDIFYGPRHVGKNNEDVCLYEEVAPQEAFEIRVKQRYAYFYTKHPELVKINEESKNQKQLQPGDIIQIGESKILIEFDSGHGFHS